MSRDRLSSLRKKIDSLDLNLLKLLNRRASIAQQIGRLKSEKQADFYSPQREKKILESVLRQNGGRFPAHALTAVFKEIFSACRALQAPMKVAYLGPAGTFSHTAAVKHFGSSSELVPANSIDKVFDEVDHQRSEFGIVPIENSTEGIVGRTLDNFLSSSLKISAELSIPIAHHLMARDGVRLGQIRKIYSHPQATAQCREWLEENCPHAAIREVESTAMAAQRAAEETGAAAIAGEYAASLYNLTVLKKSIEDRSNNFTRFVVIGRKVMPPTGRDKTSLLFSVKDSPGILYRMLEPFSRAGINLTKIESRPMARFKSGASQAGRWEYVFFLDLEGHHGEPRLKKAIDTLEKHCHFLKILGSYPKGT